jgi:hypothetical protein
MKKTKLSKAEISNIFGLQRIVRFTFLDTTYACYLMIFHLDDVQLRDVRRWYPEGWEMVYAEGLDMRGWFMVFRQGHVARKVLP